jgi:hypothetical protein
MSRRAAINTGLSVVGVALLIWQVRDVGGLAAVQRGLASVGVGFVVVLVLSFLRFLMRAVAWRALLGTPAPLSAALAATISGDALGNITPFGLAASEPAKAFYLGRHVDPQRAFAALAAENFFYSVSVAVYVIAGVVAMFFAFDELPPALRQGAIASLALMAVVLAAAGWIAWRRPTMVSGMLRRLPFKQAGGLADRMQDLEKLTYGSAAHESARLGQMALAEVTFHVLSLAESWFVLYLITGGSSLTGSSSLIGGSLLIEALILDSVSRVINVAFKMVPMRLGVDEVSSEMVGVAIGLGGGSGLVVALVRKLRMLVWAAVGLVLWTRKGVRS